MRGTPLGVGALVVERHSESGLARNTRKLAKSSAVHRFVLPRLGVIEGCSLGVGRTVAFMDLRMGKK